MLFSLSRALLFRLDPERAHETALQALNVSHRLGLVRLFSPRQPASPVEVMGLRFPNAVGLAAGLDKNGQYFEALSALGFGFVEIGTVTPRPQPGNDKPRLFRLVQHDAIINRMGFNNQGLEEVLSHVRRSHYSGVLGINVGKNKDTPPERANEDYIAGIRACYPWADYLTINVSSPNTPGLRDLQFGDSMKSLLGDVKQTQRQLNREMGRYVPIAVKIAPDMDADALRLVANAILESGLDAIIATNTTLDRDTVADHPLAQEQGGLSGRPLAQRSTEVIRVLYDELGDRLPIIGVGGITDGESAAAKIQAGARLVQLYTGLIYQGPGLIREAVEATDRALSQRLPK